MAGKIKSMSQIKQLLKMHQMGKGRKQIAKALDISKTTVKSYLDKLKGGDFDLDVLLAMDEPTLERQFHAGNPSYKDYRYTFLENRLNHYVSELSRKGVTKQLLWQEYRQECSLEGFAGYAFTQFCYHLNQLQLARFPSAVLTHQPGEKLYVDFAGAKLSYIDRSSGELIECSVFVAALAFSDYCFAYVCRSQSADDFIKALISCFTHLGGVPRVLVPDNLKAAVIKVDKYQPKLNQTLADCANHYGMVVIPARVRKPKDKAKVENQVKLIYSRVYAQLRNIQFFDLQSLQNAVSEKVMAHNQTRMQNKPYCRQELFIAEERALLLPLPDKPFEPKHYRTYKVGKNGHVFLSQDRHYYSVPYRWTGHQADVVYTSSLVSIYVRKELVATHIRNRTAGYYTSVREHLPSQHQQWLDRSPQYYIEKARQILVLCTKYEVSPELVAFFEGIFATNQPPEQRYRTCDGILRLQIKTPPETFKRAVKHALDNKRYSYSSMVNLIRNDGQNSCQQEIFKPLPEHENIRGKEYYQGLPSLFDNE